MNGGLIKSCELVARVRSGRVVKAGSYGIVMYNAAWFDQHMDKELTAVGIDLKKLSSAQPERKTGHWLITDTYPHNVYCSVCYTRCAQTHWTVWRDGSLPMNFCPNCGAKMDDEKRNRGTWKKFCLNGQKYYECSKCRRAYPIKHLTCPNCKTRMALYLKTNGTEDEK